MQMIKISAQQMYDENDFQNKKTVGYKKKKNKTKKLEGLVISIVKNALKMFSF